MHSDWGSSKKHSDPYGLVSLLPAVAQRLGVSVEALLTDDRKVAAKRGPAPKLQQQMDRITQLPRARQQFVMQVIESVLAQSSR